MRKSLGFAIVFSLLALSSASAAELNLAADPLWNALTHAGEQPKAMSCDPIPDCDAFDFGPCDYSWDAESNCCLAPPYGEPPWVSYCPDAC